MGLAVAATYRNSPITPRISTPGASTSTAIQVCFFVTRQSSSHALADDEDRDLAGARAVELHQEDALPAPELQPPPATFSWTDDGSRSARQCA